MELYGEQAILSKKLATIILDVPIEFNEEKLRYTGPNAEILRPILEDLEFKTMIPRIFSITGSSTTAPAPATTLKDSQLSMFGGGSAREESAQVEATGEKRNLSADQVRYRNVETASQRKELVEKLQSQTEFAVQVVTDDAPNFDFSVNSLALSFSPGEAWLVRNVENAILDFTDVFGDEKIKKSGHDLKSSILALKKSGIEVKGKLFDTLLAHYLIEPEASHDLGILCNQYLNYQIGEPKDGH